MDINLVGFFATKYGQTSSRMRVHMAGFVSINRGVRVFADGMSSLATIKGRVQGAFSSDNPLRNHVNVAFSMTTREQLKLEFQALARMMDNPIGAFSMNSSMTQAVRLLMTSKASIIDYTPVRTSFKSVGVIEPDMATEFLSEATVQLIADGIDILLSSVSITISEDAPHIEATVVLRNVGDFGSIRLMQPATLKLAGVEYHLVIIETSISHSEDDIQAGIRLNSPVALLAMNDQVVTKTWEATSARDAFEELMYPLSVDWQIEDWNLPDKRLSLTNVTALAGAQAITAAAGAVIQSNNDGSVLVQYRHKTPVETYEASSVLYLYDSISEVFSLSETVSTLLSVNKLRILDVSPSGFSDKIEHDAPGKKLLVFPAPWRETLRVTHTSNGMVVLTPKGAKDLTKEEGTLEFKEGTASVSYPIWSIVSVEWLGKDLGGVIFSPFGTTLTSTNLTEKYSIAKVIYKTKALEWGVSTNSPIVQFLVED